MRPMHFALAIGCVARSAAGAQHVPGRDLLEFPIGLLAEAPALGRLTGDGLHNPATILMNGGSRGRVTALALNTGAPQGVTAQLASATLRLPNRTTIGVSLVRAAVSDIPRTDTDPQSLGELHYNTLLGSVSIAKRQLPRLVAGVALRYRLGQLDDRRRGAPALDGGVLLDSLTRFDARVAVSTYLFSPGQGSLDETTVSAAADARVVGRDSLRTLRGGYSYSYSRVYDREHFVHLSGRLAALELRAGVARSTLAGATDTRLRLAAGLHYARYLVGVAREDNAGGLAPTYQFTLSRTLK